MEMAKRAYARVRGHDADEIIFFRFLKKERSAESGRPMKIIWTCLQEQKCGDLDMAHPQ